MICDAIRLLEAAKKRTLVHKNTLIQQAIDKLHGIFDDEKPVVDD